MTSTVPMSGQLRLGMHIQKLIRDNISVRKAAVAGKENFLSSADETVLIREEWEKIEQAAFQLEVKYRADGKH